MRIYTKLEYHWNDAMGRYVLDSADSFEYNGIIAQACGATQGQKDVAASSTTFMNQAQQQAGTVFGASSQVFNGLMKTFAPIVAAGPSQRGFSAAEAANLKSQAITQTGQSYKNAKQALGENLAAAGGGNTALPSGVAANAALQLANAGASQTASELGQINEADYATGRQNYLSAVQGELSAPGVYNASSTSTGTAVNAGSEAATAQNDVAQADNSVLQGVLGAVGAIGGGIATGGMSNLGAGLGFFGGKSKG